MSVVMLLATGVALLLIGALAGLVAARHRTAAGWVSFAFVLAAAIPITAVIVRAFSAAPEAAVTVIRVPAIGAALTIRVDALSAVFLAIAVVIAVLSTLFAVRYMEHLEGNTVAKYYPVLLVFFAAIVGVLATDDFFFFLVFWELMTLASFFLVIYERENPASQRAGLKYFVITHAATLCMVAAALVLWRDSGSFQFSALREALAATLAARPALGHFVLLLFFLGFATKAGVLPMGDWLPDAHPVAPSGMSAALSGALVKLGVYGLVRVFCSFVPVSSATDAWGIVLALAGTGSLFVGTLTALRQHDTKRLMAFSTIGQIGYVCLGLGVGVSMLRIAPTLAALAIAGALFHAVNHACFKACLFLGAGAVLYRTGERDMDRLGGLAAAMPATAGSTTVASLAIAGVPPLNGFASKWLILATCVLAGMHQPLFLLLALIGMFISLATLASFMKVLGSVFLGPPSSRTRVREVPLGMVVPQVTLAALCVFLGVVPRLPLRALVDAVAAAVQVTVPAFGTLVGAAPGLTLGVAAPSATWIPLAFVAALGLFSAAAYAIQRVAGPARRDVPVWTCGEEHGAEEVRYLSGSFYVPFKRAFEGIYPRPRVGVPSLPTAVRRSLDLDAWLYEPFADAVERSARAVSRSHVGVPQIYLLWIVVGAVVVVALTLALAG
jgi:hydrogenase-4 component B